MSGGPREPGSTVHLNLVLKLVFPVALLLHPMLFAWNTEVQWWLGGGSGTCSTSKDFIEYVCFVALRANPPHPNVLLWPLLLKRPN